MNTILETAGGKLRSGQPVAGRIRSNAFTWSRTMKLPTLKQTRSWSISRGFGELWTGTKP